MKRREFLQRAALAAGGIGLGLGLGERTARAFGELPAGSEGVTVPAELRVKSVLEVFLFGGLSQYESFYLTKDGESAGTHWYQFYESGDIDAVLGECAFDGELIVPFGEDANGKAVNFGPFVHPFRQRADLMARTRVVVTSHDFEPHEVAIPLALSGRRPGQADLAGLGAHVQRYFSERGDIASPAAYVLRSRSAIQTELARAAVTTGLHPGSVRPFSLNIAEAADFKALLERAAVANRRDAHDALVLANEERFRSRLRWAGKGDHLRATPFAESVAISRLVGASSVLQSLLPATYFEPKPGELCGQSVDLDPTGMNLRLAAHLLSDPAAGARYICVIDGGLIPVSNAAGGYDTHSNTPQTQATNLFSVLSSLVAVINKPGESAPGKINLDDTMVILNTEFGRTPVADANKGRGHWPYGYPVVFLGGPIREKNSGIYGAVDADANATLFSTPQENRIAVLMAMGIWPFSRTSYNVNDVRDAESEFAAAKTVLTNPLGLP